MARTREENFVIELDKILKDGEWVTVSSLEQKFGLKSKVLKSLLHQLTRANFIKKNKAQEVSITPHGRSLVSELTS
jgi:predicted transcriptional regulator